MLCASTPYRISFFGGGTDFPVWFRQHGGAVLTSTIDKFSRVCLQPDQPLAGYAQLRLPVLRQLLREEGLEAALQLMHRSDLPHGSGLGTSSALYVGLMHVLKALKGERVTPLSQARAAMRIEQVLLGETVGCQDQVATAFGGLNLIRFGTDDRIEVSPLHLPQSRLAELEAHLMLLFTGQTRSSGQIAAASLANYPARTSQLQELMHMAEQGAEVLSTPARPIEDFGRLLDRAWQQKKALSDKISSPAIDAFYAAALEAGALGGKLLGAGGGGFVLIFAPPGVQPAIEKLGLERVPFRFETQGSRIENFTGLTERP